MREKLQWIQDLFSFITAPSGFNAPLELPLEEHELVGHSTASVNEILKQSGLPPQDIHRYRKMIKKMKKKR